MVTFSYFLGIDQTGAAICKGQVAKPLKVCLIKKNATCWQVFTHLNSKPLTIESLNFASINNLFSQFDIPCLSSQLAIIADCVLGIPIELQDINNTNTKESSTIWNLIKQAHDFEYQNAKFGRNVAEKFFSRFLSDSFEIPKRQCEVISRSNSLFTTRPFQKNIQTGSFRIWKDLTKQSKDQWVNIWPFNSPKTFDSNCSWLFEGYPSLMWKEILGIGQRDRKTLIDKLQTNQFQSIFSFDTFSVLQRDRDLCDALVLALSGVILQQENRLITPFPDFWNMPCLQQEGWICGLRLSPVNWNESGCYKSFN